MEGEPPALHIDADDADLRTQSTREFHAASGPAVAAVVPEVHGAERGESCVAHPEFAAHIEAEAGLVHTAAQVVDRLRPLAGRQAGPPRVGPQSERDGATRRSQLPPEVDEPHGEVQRTCARAAGRGAFIARLTPARAECRPDRGGPAGPAQVRMQRRHRGAQPPARRPGVPVAGGPAAAHRDAEEPVRKPGVEPQVPDAQVSVVVAGDAGQPGSEFGIAAVVALYVRLTPQRPRDCVACRVGRLAPQPKVKSVAEIPAGRRIRSSGFAGRGASPVGAMLPGSGSHPATIRFAASQKSWPSESPSRSPSGRGTDLPPTRSPDCRLAPVPSGSAPGVTRRSSVMRALER